MSSLSEKRERSEKTEWMKKPERSENLKQPEGPERSGNLEQPEKPEFKAWPENFGRWAEEAFEGCDNGRRLLGNLLVLRRYVNTLRQGLERKGKEISLGLRRAEAILWDLLEGKADAAEAEDFSNDLYYCYYIDSAGDREELPEPFYTEYFGDGRPDAYEWMAVEWAAGLLLQMVSMAGGRLDFDDFEDCEHVDFYGVHLLTDQLEVIAKEGSILPFQGIAQAVLADMARARRARPEEYAPLREEYQKYAIMPEEYAPRLLEY